MAQTTKPKWVHELRGYRVRQPGETVAEGDYVQIGRSYALIDCPCEACIGHVIEHGGTFETFWTPIENARLNAPPQEPNARAGLGSAPCVSAAA